MVDGIDACLRHVESHVACESEGDEHIEPPSCNVHVPTTVSSCKVD